MPTTREFQLAVYNFQRLAHTSEGLLHSYLAPQSSLGLALGLRFQWSLVQLHMPPGSLMHRRKDYLKMGHPLCPPSLQLAATSSRVASVQTPKEGALLSLQRVPPRPMLEGADYLNSKDPAQHR